jgi:hypothetical protein
MVNKKELQQYLYGFLLVIAPASAFAFLLLFGFSGTSADTEPKLVEWPPFWISMLIATISIVGLITLKRRGAELSRHAGIGALMGITLAAAFFTYGGI